MRNYRVMLLLLQKGSEMWRKRSTAKQGFAQSRQQHLTCRRLHKRSKRHGSDTRVLLGGQDRHRLRESCGYVCGLGKCHATRQRWRRRRRRYRVRDGKECRCNNLGLGLRGGNLGLGRTHGFIQRVKVCDAVKVGLVVGVCHDATSILRTRHVLTKMRATLQHVLMVVTCWVR